MEVFQVVLYIAASLALLALGWLFVSLRGAVAGIRPMLNELTNVAHGVVEQVDGLRRSLEGTIQNVELITGRLPATMDQVNAQLAQVEGIVGSVRQLTDGLATDVTRLASDATDLAHAAKGVIVSLIDLEQKLQVKVERPLLEFMTVFTALGSGIHAFRSRLTNAELHNGNGHESVDHTAMAAEGRLVGSDTATAP
jgi:uncharacterized protein YoxC